jgi:hypothetical protein
MPTGLKFQLRKSSVPGRETLARILRWPHLAAPLAGKTVRIYSGEHGGWWREHGAGYTEHECDAGLYTFEDALARTRHCGPEKWIVYHTAA